MRSLALLGLLAFTGVLGCRQEPAVSKPHVRCRRGQPEGTQWTVLQRAQDIDERSVLLTVDATGSLRFEGRPVDAGGVAALLLPNDPIRSAPLLLEISPESTYAESLVALQKLASRGFRDISFLVSCYGKPASISHPLTVEDFVWQHDQSQPVYDTSPHTERLEISIGAAPDGKLAVAEFNMAIWNTVYFPDEDEQKAGAKGGPVSHPWNGEHPPCGEWTTGAWQAFLIRPEVARLRPYVRLVFRGNERMSEVMATLSALGAFGPTLVVQ